MLYSHIMSNIGKITLFVIFICFFLPPVFAQENQSDLVFSLTPSFGVLYGQANEIVYIDPKSSIFLSELQWNIMPLFYAGLAADFGPVDDFNKHGFIGNLFFKMGIPQKTGIMEDRDWLYDNNTLTNYSRHDNFSERAILADLSLGYSFPLFDFTALGINFDFSFMHYYWIAKNGYFQYLEPGQTWADEVPKVPLEGKVIEYTQNWFILSPGVFIRFRLGRFFSLNGNFNYSPLIYCADRDDHLRRDPITIFQDYLHYGQYLKGGGGITFSPLNDLDVTIFLSYSSITDSRGDAFSKGAADINFVNDGTIAGGGYSAFEFGLSVRLRLLGPN